MKISKIGLQFLMFLVTLTLSAQKNSEETIVKVSGHGDGVEIGAGIITGFDDIRNEVFLITAFHIIEETDSITVEFHQLRDEFTAAVFKVDPGLDLAVLRVSLGQSPVKFKKQLVAESSDFTISLVQIIGHPQGSTWVMTSNRYLTAPDDRHFTVSHEGIRKGFSGGGVFTKNNRLMGMMLENRSHDALVLDLLAITEQLNKWKVETNLLTRPKLKLESAAVMGAGTAGVLVSLLALEKKSKDQYTIYEEHLFSNDPIYTGLGMTRQQVFEDAKSKHNTAVVVGAVSGAVLAVGTYMLIRKINKRKIEKRHDGLVVLPHFDMPDYALSSGNSVSFGITLKF